jgi:hypothetical protein
MEGFKEGDRVKMSFFGILWEATVASDQKDCGVWVSFDDGEICRCCAPDSLTLLWRKRIADENTVGNLKIGDSVMVLGWGTKELERRIIRYMGITSSPRVKRGGRRVKSVDWSIVLKNRVIFDFDDGGWAYSEQVNPCVG